MYLSELKIDNFRKYGSPGIEVHFNEKLNVLIGENASGKTTIVDAIRFLLNTQSYEYQRLYEADFHYSDGKRASNLRIEGIFTGFSDSEAGNFLEWIGFDVRKNYKLRVWITAERKDNRIIWDTRAGMDDIGSQMDGRARDLLRITYLKPLRDAEQEMSAGRRSRFSQLLKNHHLFKKTEEELKDNKIKKAIEKADQEIKDYFNIATSGEGNEIIEDVKDAIKGFTSEDDDHTPFVNLSGVELWAILQRLSLNIDENQPSLGMLNLLYIAAEYY